jgi:hypothetical protein
MTTPAAITFRRRVEETSSMRQTPISASEDRALTQRYIRRQAARRPRELRRLNRRLQHWLQLRDQVFRQLEQIAGEILILGDGQDWR